MICTHRMSVTAFLEMHGHSVHCTCYPHFDVHTDVEPHRSHSKEAF